MNQHSRFCQMSGLIAILLLAVTLPTQLFSKTKITLRKEAGRHLFSAGEKERALFDDEFVTKLIHNKNGRKLWIVNIKDLSPFIDLPEKTLIFEDEGTGFINPTKNKNNFADYYQVEIEKKEKCQFYQITIPSVGLDLFCKNLRNPLKVALDEKITLRHNIFSSVRKLLRQKPPEPQFQHTPPYFIKHRGDFFELLEKIKIHKPRKIEAKNKELSQGYYLVKFPEQKNREEKEKERFVDKEDKLPILGYNKTKILTKKGEGFFRTEKLQIPLKNLMDVCKVYKATKQAVPETLVCIGHNKLPSYNLFQSLCGKHFVICYRPVKLNRKGQAVFSGQITTSFFKSKNQRIKINSITSDNRVTKLKFKISELL